MFVDAEHSKLENIPESLVSTYSKDKHGLYLSCNEQQALIYGLADTNEVKGASDFEFMESECASRLRYNDSCVRTNHQTSCFLEFYSSKKTSYAVISLQNILIIKTQK